MNALSTPVQTLLLLIAPNVFVPFAMLHMDQPFTLDFVWPGLCMVGAAYFIFRG